MKQKSRLFISFLILSMLIMSIAAYKANFSKSSFTAKAGSNAEIEVPDFCITFKFLDSDNNEVNSIGLDQDYTLEVYNAAEIPCNFYITTEGSTYNTFSEDINIIVRADRNNYKLCDMCNGTDDFLDYDMRIIEVREFKSTSEPLKFKVRLDSSDITNNIENKAKKITDYEFNLKLKLYSYTL